MKSIPYAPTIGSLMYAMVATRLDIANAVGVVSRFMHNPGRSHWNVVKHVVTYLAGTKDHKKLRINTLFGSMVSMGAWIQHASSSEALHMVIHVVGGLGSFVNNSTLFDILLGMQTCL